MWYFTWVLGLGLALAFAILNGLWHEMGLPQDEGVEDAPLSPVRPATEI